MRSVTWYRCGIAAGLSAAIVLGLSACAIYVPLDVLASDGGPIAYPPAERQDVVDVYHGVEVADPYRWLEDADAPASRAWIEAQNAITFAWLAQVPVREAIKNRLTDLINYERFGAPFKESGRYFYTRNSGLQNQSVLYVAQGLDGDPRELVDPNTFSTDGTVAVSNYAASPDGRLLAYSVADGGSDWVTIRVRDVETGTDLEDVISWVKFGGASWSRDSKGFYYGRFPQPPPGQELQAKNENRKVFYHRIGTPQSEDVLIYERPDHPRWSPYGFETEDGRYLVVTIWEGFDRNALYFRDLGDPTGEVVGLLPDWDARYLFLGNQGSVFYLLTTHDAPNWRIVAIDTANPARENWREVVPQSAEPIETASFVGGRLVVSYLRDAKTAVRVHETSGEFVRDVALPGIGTVSGFGGRHDDPETFYTFTGYTDPPTIYRYDVTTGESTLYRRPDVKFDPDAYETRQVFYTSKDGTRVPMFIVHKKGISLDGNNPTLLYGYGGFNISLTPGFSTSRLVWMEMGGVLAVANIRGGGEYGQAWHFAGTKTSKQNVFDDFIAAAEWLTSNGYTQPRRLAIQGGSNGGLLVAACMLQRPDLFGSVLCSVGVLDMMRYHTWTIGRAWASDYGTVDDPEEFKALLAYSPLHNLTKGVCYPPTLILTGDHDDRVVPAHSFKFAAALQHAQGCDNPVLIRIETRAGHGAGRPLWMAIEQIADEYAFMVRTLKMSFPEDPPWR